MKISGVITQLRTTDLESSIRFYTKQAGMELAFRHQNFYAGIRAGNQIFHLKQVDMQDPSIAYIRQYEHFHLYLETDDATALSKVLKDNGVKLVKDLHETPWSTREFVIEDDQGHTLYFGEAI
ncbi:VOC family protein [Lederbergia citrea]|uniref:VOC family protein n=1 Tax=Lederbergia citrea TaxID=2833581 RepID=A0A942US24_9BACI|nr:VOC family protein [Lederbergia citrea]MBS4176848.1 VOC family protein [Lederbergia citrea]MBS4203408.1 VOC family protein [Lederbergia citrea]MBS4221919.1 VOC family protein [Lederbergia citrea]